MAELFAFFGYSLASHTFLHLPFEPYILSVAQDFSPWLVTVVATAGVVCGELLNLELVRRFYRLAALQKNVVQHHLFQWTLQKFQRFPFLITALFALTPLPNDLVRVIAPAADYARWRYALALACGTLPRCFALAYFGAAWKIPKIYLWYSIAIIAIIAGTGMLWRLRKKY